MEREERSALRHPQRKENILKAEYAENHSVEKSDKSTCTLSELVYLLFFCVMFGVRALGINDGTLVYNVVIVAGMLLFVLKMAMTEFSAREDICIALLFLMCILVYLYSGEKGLLFNFAMMLGMKGVKKEHVFKAGLAVVIPCITVLTFLSTMNIMEDKVYDAERGGLGHVFRRSLGYPHPNTMMTTFLILCVMVLYLASLQKSRKKIFCTAAILAVSFLFYYVYTLSNTELLIFVFFVFMLLLLSGKGHFSAAVRMLTNAIYPLTCVIAVAMPLFYQRENNDWTGRFGTLKHRWYLARYFLDNNGLSLFGQRLNNPEHLDYGIDMSPMYLLIQLGVIPFIVVSIMWILLVWDMTKRNAAGELAVASAFFVMGLTEPFLYNLSFKNLLFVFAGDWFYRMLSDETAVHRALIPAGSREIDLPLVEWMSERRKQRLGIQRGKYTVLVPLVLGLAVFAVRIPMILHSNMLYTDYSMAFHQEINLSDQLYTREEMEEAKEEGNLVLWYRGESQPMYLYADQWSTDVSDNAYMTTAIVKVEAFRIALAPAYWTFWIALAVMTELDFRRKICRKMCSGSPA